MVRDIVAKHIPLAEKSGFVAERHGFAGHFCELPPEEQERLVKENPEYGEIICRCEKITKKEIRDAVENTLGAKTLVSIKYRARNGMGRCQGGFCTPRIVRMLRDEYGFKPDDYLFKMCIRDRLYFEWQPHDDPEFAPLICGRGTIGGKGRSLLFALRQLRDSGDEQMSRTKVPRSIYLSIEIFHQFLEKVPRLGTLLEMCIRDRCGRAYLPL